MKPLLGALFMLVCFSCSAQKNISIQNTSWVIMDPEFQPTEIKFEFLQDTLKMYLRDRVVESMSFIVKEDSVFIDKINGGSPCEPGELWVWKCKPEENKLSVTVVSDDCAGRAGDTGFFLTRETPKLKIE